MNRSQSKSQRFVFFHPAVKQQQYKLGFELVFVRRNLIFDSGPSTMSTRFGWRWCRICNNKKRSDQQSPSYVNETMGPQILNRDLHSVGRNAHPRTSLEEVLNMTFEHKFRRGSKDNFLFYGIDIFEDTHPLQHIVNTPMPMSLGRACFEICVVSVGGHNGVYSPWTW